MSKQALFCKTTILNILKKREPLFSGWRIQDFIGSGVSGCVFKMERVDLGQTFHAALKVIPLSRQLNRQGRTVDSLQQSLGQEAREIIHMYSLGTHQNIVGWYNHDVLHVRTEDSIISLVAVMLEFLPNTLSDLLQSGPLPWEQALQITIDCLKGLEHAHSNNIIHRDLKPGNIFITKDGTAKLGDFGVARKISEANQADTRVGTPLYIAPEVLKDDLSNGYDHLVDVYSIALVAFEMLTGSLPFEDECQGNRSCMVNMRISGEPFTFRRTFPPGVTKAVMGALAYKPSQRYASATEFRTALEHVLATNGRETFLPKDANKPERPFDASSPKANGKLPGADDELDDQGFPPSYARKNGQAQSELAETFIGQLEPGPMQKFLSSPFNTALRTPQSIILLALISCGAAYFAPSASMLFNLAIFVGYLLLPIYLLFISGKSSIVVILAFALSMATYNFLDTNNLAAIFDNLLIILLSIYCAFYAVITWFRKKI